MDKNTSDMLFETLDALSKHTNRLNTLDKQSVKQTKQLETVVSDLERQIETSSKDVLMQLLEQGNNDKVQLVKDITNTIATNIAKLSINGGNVSVNIETDSIAKVIKDLPINNTNNIVIDTKAIESSNKQVVNLIEVIRDNLKDSSMAMKLIFQELIKKEEPIEPVESDSVPIQPITSMIINRGKDGMIETVKFVRD